jgi:hypothetical protein
LQILAARRFCVLIPILILEGASLSSPAIAGEPLSALSTCVEAPAFAVNQSRKRNGQSKNCDAAARKAEAINAARTNAAVALSETCNAEISSQERQEICAARGLAPRPTNATGDLSGFQQIAGNVDGSVDTALPIGPRLCAVLRDLPQEYTSQPLAAQASGLGDCLVFHFPFVTSETRVLFTARARARCGVQCQ